MLFGALHFECRPNHAIATNERQLLQSYTAVQQLLLVHRMPSLGT